MEEWTLEKWHVSTHPLARTHYVRGRSLLLARMAGDTWPRKLPDSSQHSPFPPPHDIATQTPPLPVGFEESVQSADAEHVVTTAAMITMVLPVEGIVKDIAVSSPTEAERWRVFSTSKSSAS